MRLRIGDGAGDVDRVGQERRRPVPVQHRTDQGAQADQEQQDRPRHSTGAPAWGLLAVPRPGDGGLRQRRMPHHPPQPGCDDQHRRAGQPEFKPNLVGERVHRSPPPAARTPPGSTSGVGRESRDGPAARRRSTSAAEVATSTAAARCVIRARCTGPACQHVPAVASTTTPAVIVAALRPKAGGSGNSTTKGTADNASISTDTQRLRPALQRPAAILRRRRKA